MYFSTTSSGKQELNEYLTGQYVLVTLKFEFHEVRKSFGAALVNRYPKLDLHFPILAGGSCTQRVPLGSPPWFTCLAWLRQ